MEHAIVFFHLFAWNSLEWNLFVSPYETGGHYIMELYKTNWQYDHVHESEM